MGIYLNPENGPYNWVVHKEVFVDKALLIEKAWNHAQKRNLSCL